MSDQDQTQWWDQIKEGLAVADDALDVADHAVDTFSGGAPSPIPPPAPPPADALPTVSVASYGLPGLLAVVRDAEGWGVVALGRRVSLLGAAVGLGVAVALYRFFFGRRARRGRRRR